MFYSQELTLSTECPVCYRSTIEEDISWVKFNCGHKICEECTYNLSICPLCRQNISVITQTKCKINDNKHFKIFNVLDNLVFLISYPLMISSNYFDS